MALWHFPVQVRPGSPSPRPGSRSIHLTPSFLSWATTQMPYSSAMGEAKFNEGSEFSHTLLFLPIKLFLSLFLVSNLRVLCLWVSRISCYRLHGHIHRIRTMRPKMKSHFIYFLFEPEINLTSLYLHFLTCKMGIITLSPLLGCCVHSVWKNIYIPLNMLQWLTYQALYPSYH